MKMINKIIRAMQDTGLIDGMSLEDCDTLATAALEELLNPDPYMLIAADTVCVWCGDELKDSFRLDIYRTMIDAALNE